MSQELQRRADGFGLNSLEILLNMLVISSEGGRFPLGLIIASTFWMACFGIFVFGITKDSASCVANTDSDFFAAISALDEIKKTEDYPLTSSI